MLRSKLELRVTKDEASHYINVKSFGAIDSSNSSFFIRRISMLIFNYTGNIELDFTNIGFISLKGVEAVLEVFEIAKVCRKNIYISNMQDHVYHSVKIILVDSGNSFHKALKNVVIANIKEEVKKPEKRVFISS